VYELIIVSIVKQNRGPASHMRKKPAGRFVHSVRGHTATSTRPTYVLVLLDMSILRTMYYVLGSYYVR
jgi:hypothetical protein